MCLHRSYLIMPLRWYHCIIWHHTCSCSGRSFACRAVAREHTTKAGGLWTGRLIIWSGSGVVLAKSHKGGFIALIDAHSFSFHQRLCSLHRFHTCLIMPLPPSQCFSLPLPAAELINKLIMLLTWATWFDVERKACKRCKTHERR